MEKQAKQKTTRAPVSNDPRAVPLITRSFFLSTRINCTLTKRPPPLFIIYIMICKKNAQTEITVFAKAYGP